MGVFTLPGSVETTYISTKMSASKSPLLVSLLLVAVLAHAQRTNFAGEYAYRNQSNFAGRSDASDFPIQISVWQTQQNITIHYDLLNKKFQNSRSAYTDLLTFDGKPAPGTILVADFPDGRKRSNQLSWNNDLNGFTDLCRVFTAGDTTNLTLRITDTWSITGLYLTVRRKKENFVTGEVWEAAAAYSKVP